MNSDNEGGKKNMKSKFQTIYTTPFKKTWHIVTISCCKIL